ncbi:hypothetical protein Chor_016268, partial [Crotalus horridus]
MYGGGSITLRYKDAFTAFHLNKAQPSKYLNSLLIGELAHDQPSSEPSKNQLLAKDFRELRSTVEKMGLLTPNLLFFGLIFLHIILFDISAWLTVWYFGTSSISFFTGVAFFTIAQVQLSWLQHDLGHLSVFKTSKLNHLAHRIVLSLLKGFPAGWWNNLHFQHHAKPNCFRKDPDLNMHPIAFALGKKLAREVHFLDCRKRSSCLTITNTSTSSDLALIIIYQIRVILIYLPIMEFKTFMAFYWLSRFLEAAWFIWVSQMNHIPMNIDYDTNMDWVSTQLHATCNVDQSFFNDWFTGHLNFQIEHHKVAPLVKSLCAKYGIPYQSKPLLTAFGDIP